MTTIDSTGTSDRTGALAMERWPVACVLMWIRAVWRGWSTLEVCDHLRRALKLGEGAFPVHDYPFEEIKALTEVAGASDAKLDLFHHNGKVEAWQLGPVARLLPTKDSSGRYTFGLFPHPIDMSTMLLGLWCHRHQVQAAWPDPSGAAIGSAAGGRRELGESSADVHPRQRRGPKAAYPWSTVRVDVMDKLDNEGPPIPQTGIAGWQSQTHLESFIADRMEASLGPEVKHPSTTSIRRYTARWLKEWHAKRRSS